MGITAGMTSPTQRQLPRSPTTDPFCSTQDVQPDGRRSCHLTTARINPQHTVLTGISQTWKEKLRDLICGILKKVEYIEIKNKMDVTKVHDRKNGKLFSHISKMPMTARIIKISWTKINHEFLDHSYHFSKFKKVSWFLKIVSSSLLNFRVFPLRIFPLWNHSSK